MRSPVTKPFMDRLKLKLPVKTNSHLLRVLARTRNSQQAVTCEGDGLEAVPFSVYRR
jgi:hypothetical protein